MPSSTISIRVNGQWNGSQIENAIKDLTRLGDSSKKFGSLYTSSMQRVAVLAASTDKSISSSLANASTQLVNAGNNLQEFGRKAQEVGGKLTTHLTIPLIGIGTYAGAMAVRYDTAMANVRKVTDMTEAELEALADSALELSTVQPVSAEEILNIEAMGAQLGVADEKLEEFAMTIAGLDIATNLNANEAATQLARFANITGMAEDEYENFGSTIVAIGNNMATTESEVSNMAMRLAAAGDIAGMSEAEILGMAGAMSSLGIRAEAGGSAMTTIMSKISKAVASGGDDIEAFASVAGMSADEFAASWEKDPMDAIIALLDGIHKLDEQGLQDMNVTLGELGINEIRQSDAMRRLANDTDVLKDAVNLATNAWDENTALSDEVTQRNESMASKLQILKNRVDEIAINVGGPLVSALIDVLGAADPLIQAISGMAQAFADADEGTQQMILGLVAVAAGAGPAISVFGKFAEGVGKVKSAFGHFGQDVATFQDSMTTVDGAMMRVYNSADTLATNMGIARNKMAEVAGGADNYVKVWEEAYDAQNRYNKLRERYANLEQAAASATGNSAESIKRKMDATKAEMDVAKQAYNTNKSQIDQWRKQADIADDLSDGLTGLIGATDDYVDASGDAVKAGDKATKSAKNTGSALGTIKSGASLAVGGIKGFIASVGPMLALEVGIGAIATVIGMIAAEAQEAAEEERLLSDATMTFSEMSDRAASSAESQAQSVGNLAEKANEALEDLAALNEQTQETLSEYETEAATVDTYVATIEELANKSNLTALEQERLKLAVEGYNEITGSSVKVTDAASGKLSDSTDELKKNTEEWKRNAEAQMYQQMYADYARENAEAQLQYNIALDEQADALADLNEANAKAAAEQERLGYVTLDTGYAQIEARKRYEASTEAVEKQGAAVDSTAEKLGALEQEMVLTSEAGAALASALSGFGSGFSESMDAIGVDLDDFTASLAEAGVSTEQLKEVGSDNIIKLAAAFGGNVDMMTWAIKNYNNTPMVDKDGTVTVDDEELVDAQGNVVVWNGTELVYKESGATVDDGSLVDAQGNLYEWNGSTLKKKSGRANITGNLDSALDDRRAWNNGYLKSYSAAVNIAARVTSMLSGWGNASGGIRKHADGFIATGPTMIGPRDVMGEAGAEAFTSVGGSDYIIPLTNRRYSQPFVDLLSEGVASRLSRVDRPSFSSVTNNVTNNNYTLYINTEKGNVNSRIAEAVSAVFDAYFTTIEQGVS